MGAMNTLKLTKSKEPYVEFGATKRRNSNPNGCKRTSAFVVTIFGLLFIVTCAFLAWQIHLQQSKLDQMSLEIKRNTEVIGFMQYKVSRLQQLSKQKRHNETMENSAAVLNRVARHAPRRAFIGVHLIGTSDDPNRPDVMGGNQYFMWRQYGRESVKRTRINIDDGDNGTFIEIRNGGYYFVYAQVTYVTYGLFSVGHELVQVSPRGEQDVLSNYINAQKVMRNKVGDMMLNYDSGYSSRICKLRSGYRLGVRPIGRNINGQYFDMQPARSFFGAYFIHR